VPSGTSQLFVQTSAPTGWTKDTSSNNDSALRVVTGTAGTGGSSAFSTAMATPAVSGSLSGAPDVGTLGVSVSGNIGNTSLSVNQIAAHSHLNDLTNPRNANTPTNRLQTGSFGNSRRATTTVGGGGAHNHGHNLGGTLNGAPGVGNLALGSSTASINVKYVDVIVATKD
jgi:hypothetical protein